MCAHYGAHLSGLCPAGRAQSIPGLGQPAVLAAVSQGSARSELGPGIAMTLMGISKRPGLQAREMHTSVFTGRNLCSGHYQVCIAQALTEQGHRIVNPAG